MADFSHAEDICQGICKIIFSRENFDKLILSSGKSTSINNIIRHVLKKNKIKLDINLSQILNKKALIGSNKIARKKLGWSPKKNIYVAADEIYRFTINK